MAKLSLGKNFMKPETAALMIQLYLSLRDYNYEPFSKKQNLSTPISVALKSNDSISLFFR